jgi:hypothetical protein
MSARIAAWAVLVVLSSVALLGLFPLAGVPDNDAIYGEFLATATGSPSTPATRLTIDLSTASEKYGDAATVASALAPAGTMPRPDTGYPLRRRIRI